MKAITRIQLQKMKQAGEKIAMLTAYDACFSTMQQRCGIDVILVGDSLGMVIQGKSSTIPVTIDDMVYHTQCVANASNQPIPLNESHSQQPLILADMPFMGCATIEAALQNSTQLMQAGAHMVKLEGKGWLQDTIQALDKGGIPVCAHLGLTPQSVNTLGGYKVQGRGDSAGHALIADAQALEKAGAAMILVECIPASLGKTLSQTLSIPVIGIGAGADCDGQVLVMHDMLGVTPGKPAKFVKNFMATSASIQDAFSQYRHEVKEGLFPGLEHCF